MNNAIPTKGPLKTESNGQSHNFFYQITEDLHDPWLDNDSRQVKYCFKITKESDSDLELGYQFDVVDEGSRLRVEQMSNNDLPEYSGKGISSACIELAATLFHKPVVSSAQWKEGKDKNGIAIRLESRSEEATRVWKKKRNVAYDSVEDRYCYVPLSLNNTQSTAENGATHGPHPV